MGEIRSKTCEGVGITCDATTTPDRTVVTRLQETCTAMASGVGARSASTSGSDVSARARFG